ncbi:MAG TPA: ribosome-recycling factor [Candidatus Paceibacterota bacterium]|jgi:ribosome recycling factor|nr:ribosome-recycling factor [Candidatus Paceibacterota bacterium]
MIKSEELLKNLETALVGVTGKLKQDLGQVRSNRPSAELVQDIRVNIYDQNLSIRELGSLSVLPPRTLQITVWDKAAVGAVTKAIESGHLGLSVTNDGNNIRATLSPLGDERREEMTKLIKKTAEAARIQIRSRRDEIMKQLKDAESKKEITEDDSFKGKEKIQKATDKANGEVESLVEAKLKELGE